MNTITDEFDSQMWLLRIIKQQTKQNNTLPDYISLILY